jgi:hypothetical protein
MSKLKYKHALLLICVAAIVLGAVAAAGAYIRPANPTMDYVPQNIGIYDTYYSNFKETDCRYCHGSSVAERHHGTEPALEGNCGYCHAVPGDPTPPERDCKVCHVDGGPYGDIGFPHHRSDLSDSDRCNQCHDPNLIDETNAIDTPNYEPSSITPTPYSCENCHWPSGNVPHGAPYQYDWEKWTGYPVPTWWSDGTPDPQPIEANGPMFTGSLFAGGLNLQRPTPWTMAAKPFQPMDGTHHEVAGNVYPKCYNCHASSPDSDASWDSDNPLLIRFCENCHTVRTLHNEKSLAEHVTDGGASNTGANPTKWEIWGDGIGDDNGICSNAEDALNGCLDGGYRINGVADQPLLANNKCVACHGDALPLLPPQPTIVPAIQTLEPNFGSPGIVVNLLPKPACDDPNEPGCYGVKQGDDKVQARKAGAGNPWFDLPIYAWSENIIQVKIPAWTFPAGNIQIRVHKDGVGNSTLKTFTVRKHPVINSLAPNMGDWNSTIAINGVGFGVKQEKVYANGYGYSSYVEMHASNDKYRATKYTGGWSDTDINVKLEMGTLLDLNTGNAVPGTELYTGCWNVKVITDYFKDDGDTTYNGGLAGLDPDDELLYREISDPLCFTVTKGPYITCVSPNPVPGGDTATITGGNFGTTKGTSVVKLWNKKHTNFATAKVVNWSNTQITFKVKPKNPAKNKIKDVQVSVNGQGSNYYRITVTPHP